MEIDVVRLRYFLAVAEEQHFGRAAARLRMTAPPLSKQIRQLESDLGGPLFERGYHRISLTPLGAALVDPARDIVGRVDELRSLGSRVAGLAAPVRFGATGYAPSRHLERVQEAVEEVLAPAGAAFRIPGSSAEVIDGLLAGDLDLGLVHTPLTDDRVVAADVARLRPGIGVRSDDPLAARGAVGVDDLKDREIAIDFGRPNPRLLDAVRRRLQALGLTRLVQVGASARPGDSEIAAQARARRLAVLVTYAPDSTIGRVFSAPGFTLLPVVDDRWQGDALGIAWSRARGATDPRLAELARTVVGAVRTALDEGERRTG